MVVPTDVQAAFIVAAFFADVGAPSIEAARRESPERLERLYQRFRFRAVAYPAAFVGPSATLFLLGWPAWESQYWSSRFETTAGRPFDAGLFALFLLLLFVGGWFGNWAGFRWVLSGARKRLRALYLSVLLLTVGIVVLQWPAPIRLGAYDAFRRDPSSLPYIWNDSDQPPVIGPPVSWCKNPAGVSIEFQGLGRPMPGKAIASGAGGRYPKALCGRTPL